jgi:hypothetical protein
MKKWAFLLHIEDCPLPHNIGREVSSPMTFLGFIVAVLIIGGIFYAWYAYAGRTRGNDDAQGRNETARGAGRMRASTATETGTIGELPEVEQDKYAEGSAVNSGNIPRNVLNPDHGYDAETGTIGDVDVEPQGQSAYPDQANDLVNEGNLNNATASSLNASPPTPSPAQVYGQQSDTAGMDTATAAKGPNTQDLTSAIHQAFRDEFYEMDDNDKTH